MHYSMYPNFVKNLSDVIFDQSSLKITEFLQVWRIIELKSSYLTKITVLLILISLY